MVRSRSSSESLSSGIHSAYDPGSDNDGGDGGDVSDTPSQALSSSSLRGHSPPPRSKAKSQKSRSAGIKRKGKSGTIAQTSPGASWDPLTRSRSPSVVRELEHQAYSSAKRLPPGAAQYEPYVQLLRSLAARDADDMATRLASSGVWSPRVASPETDGCWAGVRAGSSTTAAASSRNKEQLKEPSKQGGQQLWRTRGDKGGTPSEDEDNLVADDEGESDRDEANDEDTGSESGGEVVDKGHTARDRASNGKSGGNIKKDSGFDSDTPLNIIRAERMANEVVRALGECPDENYLPTDELYSSDDREIEPPPPPGPPQLRWPLHPVEITLRTRSNHAYIQETAERMARRRNLELPPPPPLDLTPVRGSRVKSKARKMNEETGPQTPELGKIIVQTPLPAVGRRAEPEQPWRPPATRDSDLEGEANWADEGYVADLDGRDTHFEPTFLNNTAAALNRTLATLRAMRPAALNKDRDKLPAMGWPSVVAAATMSVDPVVLQKFKMRLKRALEEDPAAIAAAANDGDGDEHSSKYRKVWSNNLDDDTMRTRLGLMRAAARGDPSRRIDDDELFEDFPLPPDPKLKRPLTGLYHSVSRKVDPSVQERKARRRVLKEEKEAERQRKRDARQEKRDAKEAERQRKRAAHQAKVNEKKRKLELRAQLQRTRIMRKEGDAAAAEEVRLPDESNAHVDQADEREG